MLLLPNIFLFFKSNKNSKDTVKKQKNLTYLYSTSVLSISICYFVVKQHYWMCKAINYYCIIVSTFIIVLQYNVLQPGEWSNTVIVQYNIMINQDNVMTNTPQTGVLSLWSSVYGRAHRWPTAAVTCLTIKHQ